MICVGEVKCSCNEPFYFKFENGLGKNDRDEEIFGECENCGCNLMIGVYYKLNGEVKEYHIE